MPVGGIVEKLLAAHRAGIREVVIPKDNGDSLADVPAEVLGEMKVHLVDRLEEAIRNRAGWRSQDIAGSRALMQRPDCAAV